MCVACGGILQDASISEPERKHAFVSSQFTVPAMQGKPSFRMHKRTALSQLNEGRVISADRKVRTRVDTAEAAASSWNVLSDAWRVGLCDDIAIKFQYDDGRPVECHFGRVYRIRRAKKVADLSPQSGWIEYKKPVDLAVRDGLKNVFFFCHYYEEIKNEAGIFSLYTHTHT